ncbi:MAG: hypothetical protein CME62_00430 [Halobacteriovoraceae bacterium]|nr:hypothetical protein [Halobacteriovoraceae bacterium]|tara:strand:- start:1177 stop:1485 length:309 start_codon:yes stop_codon:yes gene_type:complete
MSKNEKENQGQEWKNRFNDLLNTCQAELKKTTQIGMKMLSASQSNTRLHEVYEELGQWLKVAVQNNEIEVEDQKIRDLIEEATRIETELEDFESDVQTLKKS